MKLPTEIFGQVVVVHTPEELGEDQAEQLESYLTALERSRVVVDLDGTETIDIVGVEGGLKPRMLLTMRIHDTDGTMREEPVVCRIDTLDEVEYFRHGGILQYVLRSLLKAA